MEGSLTVVEEFSTLHFRSSFMPGSIVGGKMRPCVGGVIETSSLRRGYFARIEIVGKKFRKLRFPGLDHRENEAVLFKEVEATSVVGFGEVLIHITSG